MTTDKKIGILGMILVFGFSFQIQAQFLNIRINIPAGMSFSRDLSPKSWHGMVGTSGEEQVPITWIAMESTENLSILVSIENQIANKGQMPAGLYINHGNWDLSKVKELALGYNQITLDDRNLLIRNIEPRIYFLKSWLGIPSNKALNIKIEYP